jgi:predicted house-cleaning noncanonical NTP pyrophosphatase (MazG superfamily)
MGRILPENLMYFLKNGIKDAEDGYEYSSELNRILNSHDCQAMLTAKEIEIMREYCDKVKKVGEITYYSEERIKDIETEHFGKRGILGFLGVTAETKPEWPF